MLLVCASPSNLAVRMSRFRPHWNCTVKSLPQPFAGSPIFCTSTVKAHEPSFPLQAVATAAVALPTFTLFWYGAGTLKALQFQP